MPIMSTMHLAIALALAVACAFSAAPLRAGTVSGLVRFEDRPVLPSGLGSPTAKPIRFARVFILNDSDTILGTGNTNGSGNYTVTIPSQGLQNITVFVQTRIDDNALRLHVQLANNTTDGTLLGVGLDQQIDTNGDETVNLLVTAGGTAAPIFNIYANAILVQEFANSVTSIQPPLLTIFFQPVPDDPGANDGTYFNPNDNSVHLFNLTSDSDGNDDAVILHEFGHYFLNNYSTDKSLGGSHSVNQGHFDIRLTYSEGFANYFSAQLRNDPQLVDSFGSDTSIFEVEGPSFPTTSRGQDTELVVASVLWDILDVDATPGHPTFGVDDDPIKINDGLTRIYDVILNEFQEADDGILEDFVKKWYGRHGQNFLRTELTQILENRRVFIDRPNLFIKNTTTPVPANTTTQSTFQIDADINLTGVNTFVAMTHRDVRQVKMSLIAPSGTTMVLHDQGASVTPDGFFDWYQTEETPVVSGNPDTSFDGQSSAGIWTLRIEDRSAGVAGSLKSFRLDLKGQDLSPDLVISGLQGQTSAPVGGTLNVSATVTNSGSSAVPVAFGVRFFLSTDSTITLSDIPLTPDLVINGLAASTAAVVEGTVSIPGTVAPRTYFLGAIVDPANGITESNETNNQGTGANPVTVSGGDADLIVASGTIPSSVNVGSSFTASATLTNVGGLNISQTFSNEFYLSASGTIDGSSVLLGSVNQEGLGAGTSATLSPSLVIPASTAAGTYNICIRTDAGSVVAEANEANNELCLPGLSVIAVGSPVDLTISSVVVPDQGFLGFTLPVTVTVINGGGTATPGPTEARVQLATDTDVRTAVSTLTAISVPVLAAGQSFTSRVEPTLPGGLTPGTYFVLAEADSSGAVSESDEFNNVTASPAILLSNPSADLTIPIVLAPPTASIGSTIPVTVSVSNVGVATAVGTFITRIFASNDNTITSADVALGDITSADLAGGNTITLTANPPVPTSLTPGLYFVGAITNITSSVSESTATNNAAVSAGSTAVTSPTGAADIVATSVSGPGQAAQQSTISIEATIANLGANRADVVFSNRIVLSTDSIIDSSDTFIASFEVPGLEPGQSRMTRLNAIIPPGLTPGIYRLGLITDPFFQVTDTQRTNNVIAATDTINIVGVGLADLAAISAQGPGQAPAGSSIRVLEGIRNIGVVPALAGFRSQWLLSDDPTISAEDSPLGTFSNGTLQPGSEQVIARNLVLPSTLTEGPRFVGFLVDSDNRVVEDDEANNVSPPLVLGIKGAPGGADLTFRTNPTLTPSAIPRGGFGVLRLSVANDGETTATGPFSVGLYLSSSATTTRAGRFLGSVSLPSLPGGGESAPVDAAFQIPADTATGIYFVGAFADITNTVSETVATNNGSVGSTVVVNDPSPSPDLVPINITTPFTAIRGTAVSISSRIANNGSVGVTESFDARISFVSGTVGSVDIGTVNVDGIGPLASRLISLSAPLPGGIIDDSYEVRVTLDPDNRIQESREDNNVLSAGTTIFVTGPANAADLTPTVLTAVTTTTVGASVTLTGKVKNIGTLTNVNQITNEVYLSVDATISTSDTLMGRFTLPNIPADTEAPFQTTQRIPSGLTPGEYFLGVLVNSPVSVTELRLDNNGISNPLTVKGAADMVPTSLSSTPASLIASRSIQITSLVINQGLDAASPPPTALVNHFYLSRDESLDESDIFLGVEVIPVAGGIPVSAVIAGNATLDIPGQTPTGSYFVIMRTNANGEIIEQETNNNLITTNTTTTVLGAPQIVPVLVIAPAVARGGQPMDVSITLLNSGRADFSGSVSVIFDFIREQGPDDSFAIGTATFTGVTLARHARTILQRFIIAPTTAPQDLYRLRTVVDPGNNILEINESAAVHTRLAATTTGLYQDGPGALVNLSYSRAPSGPLSAGPLTITARFDRAVTSPKIAIETPGEYRLSPAAMEGSQQTWSYTWRIPTADGHFYRDGLHSVRIEQGRDVNGTVNQPLQANKTFLTDTTPPRFENLSTRDGDILIRSPKVSGYVLDLNLSWAHLRVSGTNGESLDIPFTPSGASGSFMIPSGSFALPTDTDTLVFTAGDQAGNESPPQIFLVDRDRDADGLPDAWELRNGLDPDRASDATELAPGFSGLTYRDLFLHGLSPNAPPGSDPLSLIPRLVLNVAPVVDPGWIKLDASGTTNPIQSAVTFEWRQTQGPPVALDGLSTATPSFRGVSPGPYTFEVRASNAVGTATPQSATLTVRALPPTADAGTGGYVGVGTLTHLDGSASRDPNEDVVAYRWTADPSNPPGASLEGLDSPRVSFIPASPGRHRFTLEIVDATGHTSDPSTVIFQAADMAMGAVPPVADAGEDAVVRPGTVVRLDGRGSRSGESDQVLRFDWRKITGPTAFLNQSRDPRPSFVATTPGRYIFGLVVTHLGGDFLASQEDTVEIQVTGSNGLAPRANAGVDQVAYMRDSITLDGRGSLNTGSSPLAFFWNQTAGPAVNLIGGTSPTPGFIPTAPGEYRFELVVTEGPLQSRPDVTLVSVLEGTGDSLPVARTRVSSFPEGSTPRLLLPESNELIVSLDASTSYDPQGRPLTYRWQSVSGPPVVLSSLDGSTPTFTAHDPGFYEFQVTVSNGRGVSRRLQGLLIDSVTRRVPQVQAQAHSPGGASTLTIPGQTGDVITLTGMTLGGLPGSSGQAFISNPSEYRWIQTGGPVVVLDNPEAATTGFTASIPGIYVFSLKATLDGLTSPPTTLSFMVANATTGGGGGGGGLGGDGSGSGGSGDTSDAFTEEDNNAVLEDSTLQAEFPGGGGGGCQANSTNSTRGGHGASTPFGPWSPLLLLWIALCSLRFSSRSPEETRR